MKDFGTPVAEIFELPPNVSHDDNGRQMLERLGLPNWLDPHRNVYQVGFSGRTSLQDQHLLSKEGGSSSRMEVSSWLTVDGECACGQGGHGHCGQGIQQQREVKHRDQPQEGSDRSRGENRQHAGSSSRDAKLVTETA